MFISSSDHRQGGGGACICVHLAAILRLHSTPIVAAPTRLKSAIDGGLVQGSDPLLHHLVRVWSEPRVSLRPCVI
jgi:hypothetical protein